MWIASLLISLIAGHDFVFKAHGKVTDEHGSPLANVQIHLLRYHYLQQFPQDKIKDGNDVATLSSTSVKSQADGSFELESPFPQRKATQDGKEVSFVYDAQLCAVAPGYRTELSTGYLPGRTGDGVECNFVLRKAGTLHGRVVDRETHTPIQGVILQIEHNASYPRNRRSSLP